MLTPDESAAIKYLRSVDRETMFAHPSETMTARRTLAEAVLREHPPGDELPFTAGWLGSLGMTGVLKREPYVALGDSPAGLILYYDQAEAGPCRCVVVPPGSTRGDVRRFLAWQGIVLEAARGEEAV